MGLLLKIVLFGVAVYGAWKTFRYWKGMFDRFVGRSDSPPPAPVVRPAPPSAAATPPTRKVVVEDTVQCAGCGAYISTAAEKCGQCGRLRP
jgi:ribosomal protein L40E